MSGGDLVLQFGLTEGRNADAVIASQSLIAWVTFVQEAARAIDPSDTVSVELIAREHGSLRNLLRIVDDAAKSLSEGAAEYPYLKKAAIGLALGTGAAVLQAGMAQIVQPPIQKVELSQVDLERLTGMREQIRTDPSANAAAKRFFREVERDPAITDVRVAEDFTAPPMVVIPRNEFPDRGGLWDAEEMPPPEEVRTASWNVVLLRASFTHTPRNWAFTRDGLPFSAKMDDPTFLAAIAAGKVPITLQEGVIMQIEVEYRERLIGQVWEYVDRSRRVVRVVSPRPLSAPTSPHTPEKK